jgi:hypothetical protein
MKIHLLKLTSYIIKLPFKVVQIKTVPITPLFLSQSSSIYLNKKRFLMEQRRLQLPQACQPIGYYELAW